MKIAEILFVVSLIIALVCSGILWGHIGPLLMASLIGAIACLFAKLDERLTLAIRAAVFDSKRE